MREFMVQLVANDGRSVQNFYVRCCSLEEAIHLVQNDPSALADATVGKRCELDRSSGIDLDPRVPRQYI